jgi:hypothetical protein
MVRVSSAPWPADPFWSVHEKIEWSLRQQLWHCAPIVIVAIVAFVAALGGVPQGGSAPPSPTCREWHECQQLALDAYARGDYERFHDLAWRTVQTGPPRDPTLMYLVARAQSLSGRPHDALVMLGRLADIGFVTDSATNDDFRAVRQLRQWPELEAAIRAATIRVEQPARPITPSAAAASPPSSQRAPAWSGTSAASTRVPGNLPRVPTSPSRTVEVLRIPLALLSSSVLAYDRASSRFILADARQRKLVIVDERSRHLVDLVTAPSAGFYEITALEIDPLRGVLWVVSAEPAGAATNRPSATALHRLQLVSGRPLERILLSDDMLPARLGDVAVTPNGTVLVLDTIGYRILRLRPATHELTAVATLAVDATSLAPIDDRTAYVAHTAGMVRVDISTGAVAPVAGVGDVQLTGFERVRWTGNSLVGMQRLADGTRRAVRIRFASGQPAVMETIESDIPVPDGHVFAVSGDEFYFLAHQPSADGAEVVVRRTPLR